MEIRRFSVTKLEIARNNPKIFGDHLKVGDEERFNNRPKSVRWLDSVAVYHKTLNLSAAINYLENSFIGRKRTKKNIKEVEALVISLCTYVRDFLDLGYTFDRHKYKMEIILSPLLKTTGWIWIINQTNKGYSGHIVVNDVDSHDWQNHLRFPIIQNYIANKIFKCPVELVEVGIINYYEGKHHTVTYSKEGIDKALEELKFIGNEITSTFSS